MEYAVLRHVETDTTDGLVFRAIIFFIQSSMAACPLLSTHHNVKKRKEELQVIVITQTLNGIQTNLIDFMCHIFKVKHYTGPTHVIVRYVMNVHNIC